MEGNTIREAIVLFFIVSYSGVLSLNATTDIKMRKYPEPMKRIIAGEKLELEWKYQVNMSTRNRWKISLYEYNHSSGTKTKLLMLLASGITFSNPNYLALAFRKFSMELSYDKAKISIPTTTFFDSSGYGIIFQAIGWDDVERHFEKFTEIRIVEAKPVEVPSRSTGNTGRSWPYAFHISFVLFCLLSTKSL